MSSIDKILESESQNNGSFIRLYPEGAFYKAYERSAWLACVYLGRLLVKKRFVKKVNLNVTSVGFPISSLEKWAGGRRIETHDRILSFPIENKTPMECMMFLSELKVLLNAKN